MTFLSFRFFFSLLFYSFFSFFSLYVFSEEVFDVSAEAVSDPFKRLATTKIIEKRYQELPEVSFRHREIYRHHFHPESQERALRLQRQEAEFSQDFTDSLLSGGGILPSPTHLHSENFDDFRLSNMDNMGFGAIQNLEQSREDLERARLSATGFWDQIPSQSEIPGFLGPSIALSLGLNPPGRVLKFLSLGAGISLDPRALVGTEEERSIFHRQNQERILARDLIRNTEARDKFNDLFPSAQLNDYANAAEWESEWEPGSASFRYSEEKGQVRFQDEAGNKYEFNPKFLEDIDSPGQARGSYRYSFNRS